jgi:hypothetical protein
MPFVKFGRLKYYVCSILFQAGSISCFFLAGLYLIILVTFAGKYFELPQCVIFCVITLVPLSCVHIYT